MGDLIILGQWEKAKQAIAACRTIDEVKGIRDKAEALRAYAKQVHESLEVQNNIAEIKLRAERKAGEMLKDMPKNEGGWRNKSCGNIMLPQDKLSDVGIEKHESSRWQKISDIPQKDFEQKIVETKTKQIELTQAEMLRLHKDLEREKRILQENKDSRKVVSNYLQIYITGLKKGLNITIQIGVMQDFIY